MMQKIRCIFKTCMFKKNYINSMISFILYIKNFV